MEALYMFPRRFLPAIVGILLIITGVAGTPEEW